MIDQELVGIGMLEPSTTNKNQQAQQFKIMIDQLSPDVNSFGEHHDPILKQL